MCFAWFLHYKLLHNGNSTGLTSECLVFQTLCVCVCVCVLCCVRLRACMHACMYVCMAVYVYMHMCRYVSHLCVVILFEQP